MNYTRSIALSLEKTKFGPVLFGGNVGEGIQLMSKLGFQSIELSIRDSNQVDRKWLSQLLVDSDMSVSGIATGQSYYNDGYSLVNLDPDKRHKCVDRLKGHIDLAAQLGAVVILGGIRGGLSEELSDKRFQTKVFYTHVQDLAIYASDRGVRLALEPINRYETNLINTVDDALAALTEIDRDNVGLLLDTFHMNIEEPSMVDSIRKAGNHIMYMHIADNHRWAPGYGHINFGEILATLKEINYKGPIAAEILPCPSAEEAAKAVIRFWMEIDDGGSQNA